ncbi:hypothetical protein NDU88_002651 [Pleurodeles waltl]|uniref:Uncharacterized protein n=1 Tax=Pleurodeles waltl TaxID=8319 RepID=A0AAV7WQT2_PLEWA|nr:hypothetical protein NDU88_002651 [Pleurodeles waltl]
MAALRGRRCVEEEVPTKGVQRKTRERWEKDGRARRRMKERGEEKVKRERRRVKEERGKKVTARKMGEGKFTGRRAHRLQTNEAGNHPEETAQRRKSQKGAQRPATSQEGRDFVRYNPV